MKQQEVTRVHLDNVADLSSQCCFMVIAVSHFRALFFCSSVFPPLRAVVLSDVGVDALQAEEARTFFARTYHKQRRLCEKKN